VKVKLADPEITVQDLIGGMKQRDQSLAVSFCESPRHFGILGHQLSKAHGHACLKIHLLQEIFVLISQKLFFVDMNQAILKTIGNQEERQGPHKGEKKEWNNKLPLKADIVKPT
jgi:hypothetical protein